MSEIIEDKNTNLDNVLTAQDLQELSPLYEKVVLALKQVYDPEIPVNIYDLGLVYELNINKKRSVYIKLTFTSPTCPMAEQVLEDVRTSTLDVPGIEDCEVDVVFEPAWDRSMMSEEAQLELGMDGDFDDDYNEDDFGY